MVEPVFLDRTGRRRRLVAIAGGAGALLLTLMLLALVTGVTGVGPAAMPDLPAAGTGHSRAVRPVPHRIEPSPSATSQAAATRRSYVPVRPPSGGAPLASTTPAGTTPATNAPPSPTISATPTGKLHGRIPTHTPNPHASKKL